jgi:predicted Zn-dependent protease
MGTMLKSVRFRAALLFFALQVCCFADNAGQDAITKASALFRAGKIKQAETLLRSASAADPNSATLHGALGELLMKEHNYEDSVQELGLATQQDPESAEYNLLLSEALIGWKHDGVAADLLNAVRPRFGKEPQFHYDLGLAYYNLNKMKEAQGEFQEAVRLAPKLVRAEFMLAACLASTGDPTKATDILHKLVKDDPRNPLYWATLGQILGTMGGEGSAEAVDAIRRALALAPHDAHTQYVAATVFVQTGNFADARPLLEHLEKVDPKVLAVHVQLARVYSRLGQRELARKETEIANELQKQSASENQPSSPAQQGSGSEQP